MSSSGTRLLMLSCLSQGPYCCDAPLWPKQLGRKVFVWLTRPCHCSSAKEIRTGTQRAQEPGDHGGVLLVGLSRAKSCRGIISVKICSCLLAIACIKLTKNWIVYLPKDLSVFKSLESMSFTLCDQRCYSAKYRLEMFIFV